MSTLAEIKEQLKAPFALDDIDFLPKGKVERDGKTLCMALPYADPRVYQDRLNEVAYGEWSTPAPVVLAAGNKLICYVTVILCGVPHTDVGEANNNEENTGTEAWAQAFKRACSQFGLGRYLYDLEKEWVPFNPQRKQIDLDSAGKRAIVQKMYRKAGILPSTKITDQALHDLTKPGSYEQHHRNDAAPASNGHAEPSAKLPTVKELQNRVNDLYGPGFWQTVLHKAMKKPESDGPIPESAMTVEYRQKMSAYLDFVEQNSRKAS